MKDEYLDISFPINSDDHKIFDQIINQGIDSRLEGFTKSKFHEIDFGIYCDFHIDELNILLRRLEELNDPEADLWLHDIITIHYNLGELYF